MLFKLVIPTMHLIKKGSVLFLKHLHIFIMGCCCNVLMYWKYRFYTIVKFRYIIAFYIPAKFLICAKKRLPKCSNSLIFTLAATVSRSYFIYYINACQFSVIISFCLTPLQFIIFRLLLTRRNILLHDYGWLLQNITPMCNKIDRGFKEIFFFVCCTLQNLLPKLISPTLCAYYTCILMRSKFKWNGRLTS